MNERITVELIPQAFEAATSTAALLDISLTDVVNQAVIAYEFFRFEMASGAEVQLKRGDSVQRVNFKTGPAPG